MTFHQLSSLPVLLTARTSPRLCNQISIKMSQLFPKDWWRRVLTRKMPVYARLQILCYFFFLRFLDLDTTEGKNIRDSHFTLLRFNQA